ncbi:MAG: 4b protein [Coriander cytorhabdovirus 1]|nr:MAG: 4b protein [Coriander cytorhabdovirus 1]
MSNMFVGAGTTSFTMKTELIVGSENNVMSLTRSLNLFQKLKFAGSDNVRIKHLRVTYKPRTGTRGKGRIEAWVKDNRIDGDMDDPVINRCVFDATETAQISWESCIWLAKSDIDNSTNPPIVFELELTECNMTAGYSVGKVIVVVTISASKTMDKFLYRPPTLTLSSDPTATKGIGFGSEFNTKRKGLITGSIKESSDDGSVLRDRMKDDLKAAAENSLRSKSLRFPSKRHHLTYR